MKYRNESDIPEREPVDQTGKLPPFWEHLEHEETREAILLLIINEIRRSNPVGESNEACRARVAKLRGYVELLELPDYVISLRREEPIADDELEEL